MSKVYAQNKAAFHDYEILEKYEAGIILKGFEVKSIRKGKMNLKGSYVTAHGPHLLLTNAKISPYQPANTPSGYDQKRSRTLLLKANEKRKLIGKIKPSSKSSKKNSKSHAKLTLIPLKAYGKNNLVKLEIGLARGLKKYDKRENTKKKESKREMNRAKRQY